MPEPAAAQTLAALVGGIASTEPSPGSGAAGAVALALGAACARKAIAISELHHPDARLAVADARLAAIVDEALVGADDDARLFAALIAAMRRPAEDNDRGPAVRDAAAALVALAERLIGLGGEVETLLGGVDDRIYAVVAGDVAAARHLIEAAVAVHRDNAAESRRHLD